MATVDYFPADNHLGLFRSPGINEEVDKTIQNLRRIRSRQRPRNVGPRKNEARNNDSWLKT
jgi:hypothetical protein